MGTSTTTISPASAPLRLDPVAGPPLAPIAIGPERPVTIGRAGECDVRLPHDAVSRRHARAFHHGGRWYISDRGSRHGTFVNEVRLEVERQAGLADGDLLRIGPWVFRVGVGTGTPRSTVTLNDLQTSGQRVARISPTELAAPAQQRLNMLVEAAAAVQGAGDEESLVRAALRWAAEGTGFPRAAWLRALGSPEHVEVAGLFGEGRPEAFTFSRSLIREASAGEPARLSGDTLPTAHSLASLDIHSALCVPVMLGGSPVAFLYLDARGREPRTHADAAGYCRALAGMCGMALANLKRIALEHRQRMLESQLAAARTAQELLMPGAQGRLGPIAYARRTRPGLFVAGDLFDAIDLGDGRVAVCIGDVAGEGAGAGILMAGTQAFLNAALVRYGEPGPAVEAVNAYVCEHSSEGRFVTLWVGVLDGRGALRYVDAGHGYSALRRADGNLQRLAGTDGIPIGIERAARYTHDAVQLHAGDRVVLVSDGLVEQRSASGEEFGVQRIFDAIRRGGSPAGDVEALFTAVRAFAGTDVLDDDATAASAELVGS